MVLGLLHTISKASAKLARGFQLVDVEGLAGLCLDPSHRVRRTPAYFHSSEVVAVSVKADSVFQNSLVVGNCLFQGSVPCVLDGTVFGPSRAGASGCVTWTKRGLYFLKAGFLA